MSVIRKDIQCLRGIAIILVILFHFAPILFINAYLGVDIFFVISGFLMAQNLTKSKLNKISDFYQFYYRRFRRILPMYFLAIFMTVLLVHFYLFDHLWDRNNQFSLASLFFVTNQLIIHVHDDYLKAFQFDVSSMNAFIHLWSLSIEIQFYLFVPIIFFALKILKNDYLKILRSDVLGYIGDISYVTYLVHWPIVSCFLSSTFQSILSCLATIFILSVILHHIFEKQYLKLNIKGTYALVIFLISLNAYLQYSVRYDSFWKNNFPPDIKEIVDKNQPFFLPYWDLHPRKDQCMETIAIPFDQVGLNEYCRFSPGKGNMSIMMIGNSYVLNFGENIRAHFDYNYSDFRMLSMTSNYGMFTDEHPYSYPALEYSKQQVELHKPDILFIVARYHGNIKRPIQQNDPILRQINESIAHYEKFVNKKIYILDAFPLYSGNHLVWYLHTIITKIDSVEMRHLNRKEANREMGPVKQRLRKMECKKCKIFDLGHIFANGEHYLSFDRDTWLSLIDNTIHLTAPAVELCEPIFEKIVKEIMNEF